MTDLESALLEAVSALESCGLPYMLIGGLAVTAWGEARSTLDVDLSVWAGARGLREAVECLSRRMHPRPADPERFVEQTHVLPLQSKNGVRVDVIFGALELQREAVGRAVPKPIAGRSIPVATIEDLLITKLVSEREKDLGDARALLRRFGKSLDRDYLLPKLEELAEALSRPEILTVFHAETGGTS